MRNITRLFFVISFLLISSHFSFASGFNLKSIGSVDTNGQAVGHWWYTAENPLLVGDALAGSTVDISVDGVAQTAIADSNGNWQYSPTTLTTGDHQLTLGNSGATIKLTLTIGTENVDWDAVEKGGGESLPATGLTDMTWVLVIGGLAAVGLGGKMVFNAAKE